MNDDATTEFPTDPDDRRISGHTLAPASPGGETSPADLSGMQSNPVLPADEERIRGIGKAAFER